MLNQVHVLQEEVVEVELHALEVEVAVLRAEVAVVELHALEVVVEVELHA